jgi:ABC-type multidrug transport system fused ATPase/permease subunit
MQSGRFVSYDGLQKLKRTLEAVGSLSATAVSAFSALYSHGSGVWVVFWTYMTLLSLYTLLRPSSFFKHKALLFSAAFLIAIWNLRTVLIGQESVKIDVTSATAYAVISGVTFLPSLLFPFQSKLPLQLRAIEETINAESLYGEARTAIPTPRRHSPTNSVVHDEADIAEIGGANKESNEYVPSPETQASVLSRALFDFVTPAIIKHYKTQFTLEAVPDLPSGSHAAAVVAAYRSEDEQLKPERTFRQRRNSRTVDDDDDDDGDEEGDRLLRESWSPSRPMTKKSRARVGLGVRLIKHFAPLLVLQMFWAAVEGSTTLAAPLAMRLILGYIADRSHGEQQEPKHMAVLYAVILLVGGFLSSICSSQALIVGRRICIRARAILIFEIVNKALRRRDTGGGTKDEDDAAKDKGKDAKTSSAGSEGESERTTDGEVTNLVAVDVFRVSEIGAYLHFIFPLSPIQILLCVYFLVNLLGSSAVAGLAALLVAMPLQVLSARFFTRMQTKMLKATDQRLNLTNEVLNCIKTVKFFAWEKPFERRLNETREKEMTALRHRYYAWIINYSLYLSVPTLVTLITFTVHTVVLHRPLPAETAFTALALFNALRNPLDALPDMFVNVLSAYVSLRRIDKFLAEEETSKYEQLMQSDGTESELHVAPIGFSQATFTFAEDDHEIENGTAFCLRDLSLNFPRAALTIIAGPVGSGKTTLLLSLLGETRQLRGRTFFPCAVARTLLPIDPATGLSESIAYCPQSPWLLGATVKENILFGQEYDERRYRSVVKACALEPDLAILEYNDETEVGEKGTALSGGQKARIALARAVYSPARYVLLDDVLSAVDAHTAKHLYHHCLKGAMMKGRTVIMVTHAVALCLPGAAFAIALNEGHVVGAGTPAEVRAKGLFDDELAPSGVQTPHTTEEGHTKAEEEEPAMTVEDLTDEVRASQQADMVAKREKKAKHANIETYGKGNVGFKAYKLYIYSFAKTGAGLLVFWSIYVFFFGSSRLTDVANAAWLRQWASTYEQQSSPGGGDDEEKYRRTRYYLTIYGILAFVYVACSLGRDTVAVVGSLRASRSIYQRLLATIIHAKPQWFDKTPIGRIMNRLSKDVETIDQDVTMSLVFFIDVCLQSLVILLVACVSLPVFTIVAVIIIVLYWMIGALYIVSSRDLKRLESVTRSPVFTLVGEVLSGSVVIRAYGDASRFTRHCLRLIDKTNRPFYMLWCENRWLSVRVDCLATITSFIVAIFLVYAEHIDAALAGFILSFTIQLVNAVLWVMRMYTQLEINANSVERVDEYLALESERFGQGKTPPEEWPSRQGGAIEVRDLCVRYAPELPLVLRNVSFRVEAGEKIGICGRTGSGKSSLALAMFRFLEAEAGEIVVDGLDLSTVALEHIRSRLTIIPQEAQLFSGTVRFNLDPFGMHADEVLWDVLERCKLVRTSGRMSLDVGTSGTSTPINDAAQGAADNHSTVISSLDMPVEQGGKNFSAGQRQLLALARGLLKLRNSNIVILDESTASLDAGSDAAVQRTIRQEMRDATLLVVAHRIRGIVTFDKVLVLDAGKMIEFDKPSTLLRRPSSAFRELCERSGEFDLLLQMADEADSKRTIAAATGAPLNV